MNLFEVRDCELVHYGILLADINFFDLVQETNPNSEFAVYHDDMHMAYRAKCGNKPANKLGNNVIWHEVKP